ncbi:MAG: DNA gyrase subunit A, partial [Bacteroidales bacterium]
EGLLTALDHLDEVIGLIRASKTPEDAKKGLMSEFDLTEIQAKAILDLRLQKLTGLERGKVKEEYTGLMTQIERYREILDKEELQMQLIKEELVEIREKYGDERRTQIELNAEEFNPEDFYANEDMVITISHMGYIKRTPVSEFRRQNRGGVGSKGSTTREEDFIEHMYVASMHNTMLFFTEQGKCFWLKVYDIPEGTRTSKGRAIQNVINLEPDDNVKAYINVDRLDETEYVENNFIVLCTKKGTIKKTSLEAYSRPRQTGINAINIREGDQLLEAKMTNGNHEIMLAVRSGRAIRFHESTVRPMGRTASGVRGITLADENDEVIGMITVENQSEDILVVSEKGYGKRSYIADYRITNRGGKGVKTINITEKTGELIALKGVVDTDDLMIINKSGLTLRMAVSDMRVMGRATQGVRVINLKENDSIAAVAYVETSEEDEMNGEVPSNENGKVKSQNGKEFEE